jgi:hypothetical protein
LYGVISYSVAQRTHEIGVRMALGAHRQDILRLILRHGLGLTLVGLALGVGGALYLSRFLESQLFEVQARDPATFLTIPLVLAAVALLASWIPARRAAKVDLWWRCATSKFWRLEARDWRLEWAPFGRTFATVRGNCCAARGSPPSPC